MTGTFVLAREAPAGEFSDDGDIGRAWKRYVSRELLLEEQAIASAPGSGPALVAAVLDSDFCQVYGIQDGRLRWRCWFGEPPLPGSDRSALDAESVSLAVRDWASECDLRTPEPVDLQGAIDRGYVFAEEGFFALAALLGLAEPQATQSTGQSKGSTTRPSVPEPDSKQRWFLRLNSRADLYPQVDQLAAWLTEARRVLVAGLMSTYQPEAVRTSVDPHESLQGAPGGLIVLSHAWTTKQRPAFGSGDEAGWTRMLRRLRKGELREIESEALGLGPEGISFHGPGTLQVGAVIRDQFSIDAPAPLPFDHPAYLYVIVPQDLATRLDGVDLQAELVRLAEMAVSEFAIESAFLEPARPSPPVLWASEPVSNTVWSR